MRGEACTTESPTSFVAGQPDLILIWHLRLGHPSLQKLRPVVLIESSVSSFACEFCELGKHRHFSESSR